MAEYIDRKKVEKKVLGLTIVDPAVAAYADAVLFILRHEPEADVAPVVHSYWVEKKCTTGNYFECANCHKPDNKCTAVRGRYCWYCGAKMDL